MTSQYQAVFVLPSQTSMRLGACGWEFSSENRVAPEVLKSLVEAMHLQEQPSTLGMEVYEGDGMKLTASVDDRGIEHLFFQLRQRSPHEIESVIRGRNVEVFAPD
ncbi:hypothetical protein NX773_12720 [Massilia solisilvae]|uniref:DUF1488 family protein n=1 Tax=Massilia solisilvae TaxID=1811225 RepID=A0ABT2BKI5_9BURK|nr:hypothetical protein [Massilia solisilvae]MCS0609028.1 hypothetical protein [Massilia solisilvae]